MPPTLPGEFWVTAHSRRSLGVRVENPKSEIRNSGEGGGKFLIPNS